MGILQKVEKNVPLLLMSSQSNGDGLAISGAEKKLYQWRPPPGIAVVNQDIHITAWRRYLPVPLINLLNPGTEQPTANFKVPITFTASKI